MDAASILLILVAAGQSGWTTGASSHQPPPAAASSYDRYGPVPPATTSRVSPPPSVMDRAQNAASQTGTALRDGFNAGMQSASDQLSRGGQQLYDSTINASQQVGGQVQDWANGATQQIQPATNNSLRTAGTSAQSTNPFVTATAPAATTMPRLRKGLAPPPSWPQTATTASAPSWSYDSTTPARPLDPTASPGMTPVQTGSGWTSIGTNIAAPPLLIPNATTTQSTNSATLRTATNGRGPNFPGSPAENRQTTGMAPAEMQRQPVATNSAADDWASGWANDTSTSAPSIGRPSSVPMIAAKERESNLVQLQPAAARATESKQPATRLNDPWSNADSWANDGQTASTAATPQGASISAKAPAGSDLAKQPVAEPPANQAMAGGVAPNLNTPLAVAPPAPVEPAKTPVGDQPPWVPLLVVSLSLAGSLGANLFLGWSYLDARQKYQSLVRKTADTFRRVKSAAA